jgi:phosphoribosyl-AMP cyclohydrolase
VSEDAAAVDSPDDLSYGPDGLLPVVVQDASTKEVLMLAYADAEAVRRTIATRTTWFWSRSRRAYWNKGASSGNIQTVVEIRYDCDADALLVLVDPAGPACHTGERSCFFRSLESNNQRRDLRRD